MGLEKDIAGSLPDSERAILVRGTGVLDLPDDPALERVARLACRLLRCPAALIGVTSAEGGVVAAAHGLEGTLAVIRRASLMDSFGAAVAGAPELAIEDARQDPRMSGTPAVTATGVVAFASAPLVGPMGESFGMLAVLDRTPRSWSDSERADLRDLAAAAVATALQGRANEADDSFGRANPLLSYDALPVMIWTVSPDGACDYANARWLEFTGRALGSELGVGWTEAVHPDDRPAYVEQFRRALDEREPLRLEYRARRHDGHYRWLLDVAVPRFGSDGAFLGVVGCSTDVTDRRQLEQRLVRAERAQAIGQLAGGIAHDFNNLLTGIIGHVALLQEESSLSELAREDLDQIQRSADRAASLTRQLLAFSRRQKLAPRVLDLNQLVSGCLTTLRRLVGDRVQVVFHPVSHLDPIVADPNQLEHVFTQLGNNAREWMPEGGTLELRTRQERLDAAAGARLQGLRAGVYVVLQVRDTGRGMDPPTMDRIFEPFFSTKPQSEGAGLGLASVYGIVKQSGGHIDVASELGRGTTFTIYFPRHEGSGPVGSPAVLSEPAGGNETILLVEDEPQVLDLARRVLERVGYTVLAAADAESATAIADRHAGHIHLLVTDMILPHLGGRELAARLSIHRPAIKVLYISGTSDNSIARLRLLEPGMEFLEKPFSLDRLLRTVRQTLSRPDGGTRPS